MEKDQIKGLSLQPLTTNSGAFVFHSSLQKRVTELRVNGCENQTAGHLLLRAGLLQAAGYPMGPWLDSVDTIWQCTVPSSSMRHMGPNVSLALALGTSRYSSTAATEGSSTKPTDIRAYSHSRLEFKE